MTGKARDPGPPSGDSARGKVTLSPPKERVRFLREPLGRLRGRCGSVISRDRNISWAGDVGGGGDVEAGVYYGQGLSLKISIFSRSSSPFQGPLISFRPNFHTLNFPTNYEMDGNGRDSQG